MGSNGLKAVAAAALFAALLPGSPKALAAGTPKFCSMRPLAERWAEMPGLRCGKTFGAGQDTLGARAASRAYWGAGRIAKETPWDTAAARAYCSLVDSVAQVLKGDFGIGPGEPQRFMREILGLMYGNLNFSYGNEQVGYLGASVRKGKWDCDNSAYFVVDVAHRLGIEAGLAVCIGHILAVVGGRHYETREGDTASYSEKEANAKYKIYFVAYDEGRMEYLAYLNRANEHAPFDAKIALENVLKAIELAPEKAELYYFAGCLHADLGNREKAAEYAVRSVETYPCAETWNGAGKVHYLLGRYGAAISCFRKALEMAKDGGMRSTICGNLSLAFMKKGDLESARKYSLMAAGLWKEGK